VTGRRLASSIIGIWAEIDASVVFLAFSCTGVDLGATTSIWA
jgi:hypothetical protein